MEKKNQKVFYIKTYFLYFGILILLAGILSGCKRDKDDIVKNPPVKQAEDSSNDNEEGKDQLSDDEKKEAGDNTLENDTTKDIIRELTVDELLEFTEFINSENNYGFLLSQYDSPQKINLEEALYNGTGSESNPISEEEKQAFLEVNGWEINTDCTKLTTSEINEYLQKKMDISFHEITSEFNWTYLKEYDSWYFVHGDTNYTSFTCTSGRQIGKDIYELECAESYEVYSDSKVILCKVENDYQFVSNTFIERLEKRELNHTINPLEISSDFKMESADYSEEFNGINGCAVLFDSKDNTYTFYNEKECKEQVSPNSTFKIISTLSGLHNQVIISEESEMEYNGTIYPIDGWNKSLNLKEAFQSSCIWYFRKVIDRVGQINIEKELQLLQYGNSDSSSWEGSHANSLLELNGFWLDSSLKISPYEQVQVLQKIIEGKTIYTTQEVNILKNIMLYEEIDNIKIYGKTGTGVYGNAWFVGFAEQEGDYTYFAVYLNDSEKEGINGAKAKEIAGRLIKSCIKE